MKNDNVKFPPEPACAGRADLGRRLTSLPGLANPAEAGGAGWLAQQSLVEKTKNRILKWQII